MANTYVLLGSNLLTSSTTSIAFNSIPQTYTDLVLKTRIRCDVSAQVAGPSLKINGSSSAIYSDTQFTANGATVSAGALSGQTEVEWSHGAAASSGTANIFSVTEFYFPNYAGSSNKAYSAIVAAENNTTTAYIDSYAHLFSSTSAITSLSLTIGAGAFNILSGSSFYLYGISKS